MSLNPHPFTLRQLQYLVAVAEQRNFRKAAELCHVAQPSLSAQIAALETALGVALFERSPRAVLLTEAGAEVLAQAKRVLGEADEIPKVCTGFADPLHATWRLGIIPTVAPYLLPSLSRDLQACFPSLGLHWIEDRTARLLDLLDQGELDGAVLALESNLGPLEHAVIGEDPFVLALSSQHPLARHPSPVPQNMLEGESVLLLEDGHCFRDQALKVCAQAGAREMAYRATSLSTLAQLVARGEGITLLPRLSLGVENRHSELVIQQLGSPQPFRTLALCWRHHSSIGNALETVASRMVESFRACCLPDQGSQQARNRLSN